MNIIQKEFMAKIEKAGTQNNFQCKRYRSIKHATQNILELSGNINCMLYYKIRTEPPPRWGVTKPRVKELEDLGKKWFLILLYESPESGYLLSANDVRRSISENLWPLGSGKNKNEYKVQPGKTLQYSKTFESLVELVRYLK